MAIRDLAGTGALQDALVTTNTHLVGEVRSSVSRSSGGDARSKGALRSSSRRRSRSASVADPRSLRSTSVQGITASSTINCTGRPFTS